MIKEAYRPIKIENNKIEFSTYLIALYFLLSPFEDLLNIGNGTMLKYLAIVITAMIFVEILARLRIVKIYKHTILPVLILIFVSWISVFWSVSPETSIQRNVAYTLLPVFFIIVSMVRYSEREIKLIRNFIILAGVVLVITYGRDAFSGVVGVREIGRFSMSEANNPNAMAAAFFLTSLLSISMIFLSDKTIYRIFAILCSIGCTFIIFMTGSRMALLGLTVALLYFVFTQGSGQRVKYVIGLILFCLSMYYVVDTMLPEDITQRLFSSESYSNDFDEAGTRSDIWRNTVYYVLPELSLVGVGSGCAPEALFKFYGFLKAMHNTYLNMLVELGILGLPVFAWLLYGVYKQGKLQNDTIKIAALIGMMIIINFGDFYSQKSFWNVLMYCCISKIGYY